MSLVEELKELLKKKKYAISYAAKAINVSNATLLLWINNNYKGNVKKIDDAVAILSKLKN
jgi:transcriptional regulator with XRE-family HTH domain